MQPVVEEKQIVPLTTHLEEPTPMPPREPITERFEIFHAKHPEVYEWFDYFVREILATGAKKVGAPVVWERIRYETYLTTGERPYRLPNELRP